MAAEVTSLGTHTDLWRPHEQTYSSLARKQGWARMHAAAALGHRPARAASRPSVAAATGLARACEVACGIHDSNASYLRFLMDREREAFTVVSSGTWTIVMANRGDLRRLIEATRHARQRQCVRRAGRHGALHGRPRVRSDRAEWRRAHGRCGDRGAVARARSRCRRSPAPGRMPAGPGVSKASSRCKARSAPRSRRSIRR